jgi:hypothetical protein
MFAPKIAKPQGAVTGNSADRPIAGWLTPRLRMQTKLEIGPTDDRLERNADRVAELVTHAPFRAAAVENVGSGPGTAAREAPDSVLEVLSSSGQPLDASTRAFFEPRFRHDFGAVRVHADETAAQSARDIGALAYTFDRHVAFGAGQFAPESPAGRGLIAHELAHVVQQDSAGAREGSRATVQRQEDKAAKVDSQSAPGPASSPGRPADGGFPTAWKAAFAALQIYNPQSILSKDPDNILDNGKEYGGLIYKIGVEYFFTPAVVGSGGADASSAVDTWEALSSVPDADHTIAGDYHTHGAPPNPRRDPREASKESGEDFSGVHAEIHPLTKQVTTGEEMKSGDIYEAKQDLTTHAANILDPKTYTIFLGTPLGRFALYTPGTGVLFSFSPDARLLPSGQEPAPSSYAR